VVVGSSSSSGCWCVSEEAPVVPGAIRGIQGSSETYCRTLCPPLKHGVLRYSIYGPKRRRGRTAIVPSLSELASNVRSGAG
jgi:hypothetical protein